MPTLYKCLRCRTRTTYNDLMGRVSFKCLACGYTIFKKVRVPIVKHLKCR